MGSEGVYDDDGNVIAKMMWKVVWRELKVVAAG